MGLFQNPVEVACVLLRVMGSKEAPAMEQFVYMV